jgi:translation initiation factor 1
MAVIHGAIKFSISCPAAMRYIWPVERTQEGITTSMNDSRLVYSTEPGRVAKKRSKSKQSVSKGQKSNRAADLQDGIIRIRREVKGRKGKQVTVVSGLPTTDDSLKRAAARLKRTCGSGGSIKDGCVIIQGDHRDKVLSELRKQGYSVKMAGG